MLGTQEGYLAAPALAKEAKPVIVSFEFPRPDQVTGRAVRAPRRSDHRARSEKRELGLGGCEQLRGNAAALVKAGVPVAFTTYGL